MSKYKSKRFIYKERPQPKMETKSKPESTPEVKPETEVKDEPKAEQAPKESKPEVKAEQLEPVKEVPDEPMTRIKTSTINDLINAFETMDAKRNEPCMQCRNSGPHSARCDIGKAIRNAKLEVGG